MNGSKQDKCFSNKHENYNMINYKSNKELEDNKKNLVNTKKWI